MIADRLKELEQLCIDDGKTTDIVLTIAKSFISEGQTILSKLYKAIYKQDQKEIDICTHNLKSMSLNLEANSLAYFCDNVTIDTILELEKCFESACEELDKYIERQEKLVIK